MEPIDNVNGSNVEVMQVEVFNDDDIDSNNDRKLPAHKDKDNDDGDGSINNRKIPAGKKYNYEDNSNNNSKMPTRNNDNDDNKDNNISYYDVEEDDNDKYDEEKHETFPPQPAAAGNSNFFSLFFANDNNWGVMKMRFFQCMITALCVIPWVLVVQLNQTTWWENNSTKRNRRDTLIDNVIYV